MEKDQYTRMFHREQNHWFAVGRRQMLNKIIEDFVPIRPAKILEIGSGTGGNIPMLSNFGTLTCVEMSDYARALAMDRLGGDLDIRVGLWPDCAF